MVELEEEVKSSLGLPEFAEVIGLVYEFVRGKKRVFRHFSTFLKIVVAESSIKFCV